MSQLIKITPDGKVKYFLTYYFQGVNNCCGADILYGISLVIYNKTTDSNRWLGEWITSEGYSKKELIEALDLMWGDLRKVIMANSHGMIIILDNVERREDIKNFLDEKYPDDKPIKLTSATFVSWLILRGHGTVARGITSVNLLHAADSVLTSWTWCPEKERVLSLDQALYESSEVRSANKKLMQNAEKFNKLERKFYESAKERATASEPPKKAVPPAIKRASTGARTRNKSSRVNMPVL